MNSDIYKKLPIVVSGIGNTGFYDRVISLFGSIDGVESCLIIHFKHDDKPKIYRSPKDRNSYDKVYKESAYVMDPAYISIKKDHDTIFFSTLEVNESFTKTEYYKKFYRFLSWKNESNIVFQISATEHLCIVIGSSIDINSPFHPLNQLSDEFFPLIRSILSKHTSLIDQEEKKISHRPFYEYGLTKKQEQIAKFILEGLSSRDISLELSIAEGTVKNHRKHIYKKLGIHSQSELFKLFSI